MIKNSLVTHQGNKEIISNELIVISTTVESLLQILLEMEL